MNNASAVAPEITLIGCPCCGLIQHLPIVPREFRVRCTRCHTRLLPSRSSQNQWAAAVALAALLFYPLALLLPLLRIERLGHAREDSLLGGISTLLVDGHWLVGAVVLVFSVLLPPLKLFAICWLTRSAFMRHRHRALMYHLVELLGRWGMLDVLLVAVMIAYVKLGDLITIQPGPGLQAFIIMVLLSLLASLCFNPRLMWWGMGPGKL